MKIKYKYLISILNIIKNFFNYDLINNIFGNIWLYINNNYIKFTILNLESQITCYIKNIYLNTKVINIIIPGYKLYDICRKLSMFKYIYLYIIDNILIIKVKNIQFNINLLNIENYPNVYKFNHKPLKIKINNKIFKNLLLSTYFCISQKKINNYIVNGLYLIIKNKNLSSISGDGYRLSTNNINIEINNNYNFTFLLSKKSVNDLIYLLQMNNNKNNILLYLNKNYLQINFNKGYYITRLIIGYYPKIYLYKDKIKINKYKINFNIKVLDFLTSVTRILSLNNDRIKKLTLKIKKNLLIISTINSLNELSKEYININYNGINIKTTINGSYLLDVLNNILANKIFILINKKNLNMIIQNTYNKNNFYLIMPINF